MKHYWELFAIMAIAIAVAIASLAMPDESSAAEMARPDAIGVNCLAPRPLVPGAATVKGVRLDDRRNPYRLEQRRVMTAVLNQVRARGIQDAKRNRKVSLVAIVTIIQEQSSRNQPWGHGTSVGAFQLISTHGSVAWRMKLRNSTSWHVDRSVNITKHKPWLTVGQTAQAVQGSAYPTAYAKWTREAVRNYHLFLGPCRR